MTKSMIAAGLLILAACSGGDGGSGGTGPGTTASLTGFVREASTNAPIQGATVTAGTVTSTTAADGRFTLQNVPIGASVSISVTAAGFDNHTQALSIQAGSNNLNVTLSRKTIFELGDKLLYLPADLDTVRGILFDLPASTADSRPWIRGNHTDTRPGWGDIAAFRTRALAFAQQHRFAILGSNTFPAGSSSEPATLDGIIATLGNFATATGHPELTHVPLLLFGHSLGGCVGYNFMRRNAARVIALVTQKGPCHAWVVDGGAENIPAYLVIGLLDPQNSIGNITGLFERGREQNAPWSVVVMPEEDHARTDELDLLFHWLNTVVSLRVPTTITVGQPVPLQNIDITDGWLANRTTGVITGYACYSDDEALANWFPTEQTARDWRTAAGLNDSAPVTAC